MAFAASCGISISVSHNLFEDNGIKILGGDGFKIPDATENEIETLAQSLDLPFTNYSIGARRDAEKHIDFDFFVSTGIERAPQSKSESES